MMRLETFYQLLGPDGQQLLAEYGQEPVTRENHLQLASRLREVASSELASAVLETLILRQKAAAKFERAGSMYFTRDALEQASSEIVSRYRASRYHEAGFTKIADLGCGIGGDALSLCQAAEVTGVEWNPLRLAMAQENVRIYGLSERFHPLQADLLELSPLEVPALFADPGRRDEYGGRIYSVHDYRPPLSTFEGWLDAVPHQGIKIGPGVDYAELPIGIEIEFVSVRGEVREGVLWRGDLRTEAGRRATLLPGGATLTDFPVGSVEVAEPKEYLYEPDGAVIRAHLVEQLAHGLNATKIDDNIAYLAADDFQETEFARCYVIEDVMPFQLKRLRSYLRDRRVGRLTIKKRGSPLDPDALRKKLRLVGEEEMVIFLTKAAGKPTVLAGKSVVEKID